MLVSENLTVDIINMGFFTSSSYPFVTINFLNRQYTYAFPVNLVDELTQYHFATIFTQSDNKNTLSSDQQKELMYLKQRIIDVASEIDEQEDDREYPSFWTNAVCRMFQGLDISCSLD